MWSHLLEEDIRPLYLAPPDFCTQRRVENRLGRSRQTNAFQSTDIPLLVGALDAHTVKFSDLDRGDGWTGQDTPEKSFGSLWRHRLCFRGRTAELKSRAKAALVTLARWEHSFCPVPARQWGLRSASRSSTRVWRSEPGSTGRKILKLISVPTDGQVLDRTNVPISLMSRVRPSPCFSIPLSVHENTSGVSKGNRMTFRVCLGPSTRHLDRGR